MPDFLKGSTATVEVQLAFQGATVEATVTGTVVNPDGVKILDSTPATAMGDGWYRLILQPANLDTVGTYRVHWVGIYGTDTLAVDTVYTVGLSAYPSLTVADIRHMIAETELGGMRTGRITGVDGLSLYIASWAHLPEGDLIGQDFYIYGGKGAGCGGTILTHTPSATGAVITTTPLSVTPDTTSLVEVHKTYTVEQYSTAIRRAQMSAAERLTIPMTDKTIIPTAGQTVFDVPSGFVALFGVYQDGEQIDKDSWDVIPGRRQIVVTGATADIPLELRGVAPVGDILSDFSIVEVPPEYLVNKVCAMLLRTQAGGPSTDPDQSAQRAAFYEQMAMSVLARQPQRIKPDTRRV